MLWITLGSFFFDTFCSFFLLVILFLNPYKMTVSQSSRKDSRSKYIYIASVVSCIVLWITVYSQPTSDSRINQISSSPLSSEPQHKNEHLASGQNVTDLCTPESFNQGKWIYDPIKLENPFSSREIARAAGYHCVKKFAHRCFRRAGDEVIRAKKM
jgi:hypothetical protein